MQYLQVKIISCKFRDLCIDSSDCATSPESEIENLNDDFGIEIDVGEE